MKPVGVLEHAINLSAAKILATNLARLSADWLSVHGQPLLLAETFVTLRALPAPATGQLTGSTSVPPAALPRPTQLISNMVSPSASWSTP